MIYGGLSQSGNANSNTVNISGGDIKVDVQGGYSLSGLANGNTVNISGGTIQMEVYGGYSDSGSAINNTINISGNPTFGVTTILYGGYIRTGTGDNFTGNTLNIHTKSIAVRGIANFEFINFYLPNDIKANDTLLSLSTVDNTNLSNSKIGVGVMDGDSPALKVGDKIILIDEPNGTITPPTNMSNNISALQGISNSYEFSLAAVKDDGSGNVKQIVATSVGKKVNENQKAILEGGISSAIIVSRANDTLESSIKDMSSTLNTTGVNETSIGSIGASSTRSNTGSHVDIRSISLLTGVSKKANDSFMYSAFFEAGSGNYNSYNSFVSGNVKGSGDSSYFGFGVFSKFDMASNYYFENSFRVGQVKSDFKSDDFGNGNISSSFESKRAYFGTHIGLGKIFDIDDISNLDIYTKVFYTRVNSEDITMSTNDRYKFDAINSVSTKLGFLYNYKLKENLSLYTGAGIQREFKGEAKGRNISYNYDIDSPSIKGNTGSIEAGIKLKPINDNDKLTLDIGVMGLVGKNEGVSGRLGVEWRL
ncbi:putative high-molecular-weight surface-exposed protein [Campylobacter hyointestinalis subsp. hyointestinalis]|uniref:autotransporter outer membrane beta-barrel domain-containing protein n=1 Tax=Campylobacter hyointestinalis TaxID=198 RepID=UPI000724D94A|nr:autotransporter outer membrane beta-barrel domain-containing protein [Campylobacter hyointestinalis]CUU87993.1 putative high-molecular-weight surface-exposed protein [Campylobacter hyointestinalis subsp. hyointestinalis]